jgi:hypothetical protein
MRARVLAWCDYHGVDPADLEGRLFFVPEPVNLGNSLQVSEAVEVAAEYGAVLVVFDTRARCTQGLEENSATDQGRAIDAAERIQRASGATVLVVHHSGRAGEHGRGSNAWDGAVFSELRLTGGDQRCQIHCAKHEDVPDGCDHHYRLVPHVAPEGLMPACDLQQRSTLVAVQAGRLDERTADRRSTRVVLEIIRNIGGDEGLTKKQIVDFAVERHVARSTAYEAVNALVKRAVVYNRGTDKRRVYVAESGDA